MVPKYMICNDVTNTISRAISALLVGYNYIVALWIIWHEKS